ncbi:MAG: FG-GAP-like repeat-containing protein [Flammeovirgaceae bacterium]
MFISKINFIFFLLQAGTSLAQPSIRSFAPTSAGVGSLVTINGANFNNGRENNSVFFGAVKGTVIEATTSQIIASVPAGATLGPISVLTFNQICQSSNFFLPTFEGSDSNFSFAPLYVDAKRSTSETFIGDLDLDGKPDIVCLQPFFGIRVLRNSSFPGSMNFEESFVQRFDLPSVAALADFNSDGKLDIIVGDSVGSGSLFLLKNTSTANVIAFEQANLLSQKCQNITSIVTGDFDGDGKIDLAIAKYGFISLLRNTSGPTNITFELQSEIPFFTYPNFLLSADLNGDLNGDLVATNLNLGGLRIFRNVSNSSNISFVVEKNIQTDFYTRSLKAGDIDGDGYLDIIFADSNFQLSILRNKGNSIQINFDDRIKQTISSPSPVVSFGDFNGDGKIDLFGREDDLGVYVIRNTSTPGNISFGQTQYFGSVFNPGLGSCADLDGDERPDLIQGGYEDTKIAILRNVIKKKQSIKFEVVQDKTIGDAPFSVFAKSSSLLPVSFTSSSEKIVIAGDQVEVIKPGRAIIVASQSGNNDFAPADEVSQSFCIRPAKPTISNDNTNSSAILLVSSSANNNQWYVNNEPIVGATSQTISVTNSGLYSVRVSVDGCYSESEGFPLAVTGDIYFNSCCAIYPNPIQNNLSISLENDTAPKKISILDMLGNSIREYNSRAKNITLNVSDLASGQYLLTILTGNTKKVFKVIKY